jgi:hypothetical protein
VAVSYKLAKPVQNNKDQFKKYFPKAPFLGDIGDAPHLKGSGDHTPWASDVINGKRHQRGTVYAMDLGNGSGFDSVKFSQWLLQQVKAGKYPEVKYFLSNYKLWDRRYSWRQQKGSDGPGHVHLSFMPGQENTSSQIMADYYRYLHPPAKPPAKGPPTLAAAPVRPAPPVYPIKARTLKDGKVLGSPIPNARVVPAKKAPVLSIGAGDDKMGGWVTYAEHKLGVPANGYYGPEMVKAVKALQKARGLPQTGQINEATWRSLGQK